MKLTRALTYLLPCTSITASIPKSEITYLSTSIALFWIWAELPLKITLIAPKVSVLSEGHPASPGNRHPLMVGHIRIKKNAWIGAGAIILPGVTIGENSIVAAGAVVSISVPDNTIVGDIPAKVIKEI